MSFMTSMCAPVVKASKQCDKSTDQQCRRCCASLRAASFAPRSSGSGRSCDGCSSEDEMARGPRPQQYEVAGCDGWTDKVELPGFEQFVEKGRRRHGRRNTAEEFAALADQLGLKHCPQCGNACAKEDEESCDHMTCVCGKEFCWSCLADRSVILHHGNHYHAPDCRFYTAYSGPLEYVARCPECKRNGRPCRPPPPPGAKAARPAKGGRRTAELGGC